MLGAILVVSGPTMVSAGETLMIIGFQQRGVDVIPLRGR
jgi:hypothetical protein